MHEDWHKWETVQDIIDVLNRIDVPEAQRRAAIITELSGTDATPAADTESYRYLNAMRYGTNDSGGNSSVWYFTDDGRALFLSFWPESRHYPESFEQLAGCYRGVPDDLVALAGDPTVAFENSTETDPATGKSLLYSTDIFWYDGQQWHIADGLLEQCDLMGVDYAAECVIDIEHFVGDEFTPESFTAWYGEDWDPGKREAILEEIRPVFAKHAR